MTSLFGFGVGLRDDVEVGFKNHETPYVERQLFKTPDRIASVDAAVEFGQDRISLFPGFGNVRYYGPQLLMRHKWILSDDLASFAGVGYKHIISRTGEGGLFGFAASGGALRQLTDVVCVEGLVTWQLQRNYGVGALATDGHSKSPVITNTFPIQATVIRSMSPAWDVGASYRYRGIGYPHHFSSHAGSAFVTTYW